jgi:hypothetical protein
MAKVMKTGDAGLSAAVAASEELLIIEGVQSLKEVAEQLNESGKNSHDWEKVFSVARDVRSPLTVALGNEAGEIFQAQTISLGNKGVKITYLSPQKNLSAFQEGKTTELAASYLDHCSGKVHDHTKNYDLELSGGTPEQALAIIRFLIQKNVHPVDLMDGGMKKSERGFEFNNEVVTP